MIDDTRYLSKSVAFAFIGIILLFGVGDLLLVSLSGSLPAHFSVVALGFVYLSAFLVNPVLMLLGMRSSVFKIVAIAWAHLTVGVLIIWFNEILGPFTALWSMLIVIASIYGNWKGFIASSLFLAGVAATYCTLFYNDLKEGAFVYSVVSAMVVAMTVTASYFFVRILMNSRKKARDLVIAQKSEQMQTNRQATLLNSISDAVLTLNRYGRVTSQNAAAQAFFDTNEPLVGRDIDKLLLLTDEIDQTVSVRALMQETRASILRDDLSVTQEDEVRHLSFQMSHIRSTYDDSEEYGVVLIIRDITKQKTLEEEKDEFISVTSHELRTPVAIAEGSLSNLLVMEERNADAEKLRSAAETAHEQVLYLAKIINDLSTLSRAERGVGDVIEEINVNRMMHDLFTQYTPEAQKKSLHLDLDVQDQLPKVKTSRLYLEEMLENFLTNALKYTKTGSITLGAKMNGTSGISFWVKDTGIGISKSDQAHIFERFYRSEDYRTRETSGTGLGLYVVEKLADKLETKIEVESKLNHGSTFSFILPLQSAKFAIAPQPDAEKAPAAQ